MPAQPQRNDALKTFYGLEYQEETRYHDYEWKTAIWTVALLGAVAVAARAAPVPAGHQPYVLVLMVVFALVAAWYGVWHIHYVHTRFVLSRNLRRECERLLGLHKVHRATGEPLFPYRWREERCGYWDAKTQLVSWWGLIILTWIYATYSIVMLPVT